jgi:hypothetical protein
MLLSTIDQLTSTARPAPSDSHRRVAAGPQKGKGAGLHVKLTRSGGVHDEGGPAYPYTLSPTIHLHREAGPF